MKDKNKNERGSMEKIEKLRERQKHIAKRITQLQAASKAEERKAEAHLKIALGGAVLIALDDVNVSGTVKYYLLNKATQGIQPQGRGRELFNALLEKHRPKAESRGA